MAGFPILPIPGHMYMAQSEAGLGFPAPLSRPLPFSIASAKISAARAISAARPRIKTQHVGKQRIGILESRVPRHPKGQHHLVTVERPRRIALPIAAIEQPRGVAKKLSRRARFPRGGIRACPEARVGQLGEPQDLGEHRADSFGAGERHRPMPFVRTPFDLRNPAQELQQLLAETRFDEDRIIGHLEPRARRKRIRRQRGACFFDGSHAPANEIAR